MHVCVCHLKRYCYLLHMPTDIVLHTRNVVRTFLKMFFFFCWNISSATAKNEWKKWCKGKESECSETTLDGNDKRIKRKIMQQQQQQRIVRKNGKLKCGWINILNWATKQPCQQHHFLLPCNVHGWKIWLKSDAAILIAVVVPFFTTMPLDCNYLIRSAVDSPKNCRLIISCNNEHCFFLWRCCPFSLGFPSISSFNL